MPLIGPPQDDKDPSSNKESLDDLFPTEEEEPSQSKSSAKATRMWVWSQ